MPITPATLSKVLPRLALASYAASILLLAAMNLVVGPRIATARIPMQWGSGGNPNTLAPKQVGLWFPVLLTCVVAPSIVLALRRSAARGAIGLPLGLIATCILLLAVHAWHLCAILAWTAAQP